MSKDKGQMEARSDGAQPKPYGKPTLTKGPVLSRITAGDSGVSVDRDDS